MLRSFTGLISSLIWADLSEKVHMLEDTFSNDAAHLFVRSHWQIFT